MLIATSFLSSKNPAKDLKKLNDTDTDFIHVDVMDGKFVPNKTMPFREMSKIYKYTDKRLDVHLMVQDARSYIEKYATLNTEAIIIHVESKDVKSNLEYISEFHVNPGLAISPKTPVADIIPYLPLIKEILIMSVEPGYGGQEFIISTVDKIKEIKKICKEYNINPIISIDGGVNNNTIKYCRDSDMVVSGSYIINSDNFQEKIDSLR